MGCSKNLVDSERLMRQFQANGYTARHNPVRVDGEIVIVNTCGFIAAAKEESINMILELCQAKEQGKIRKVFVMGCLSERYREDLKKEIPQVDKFYGKFDWKQLLADLGKAYRPDLEDMRTTTTPKHYAYLKIAEGCNRMCAYCAIPLITGRHVSRPMEEIVKEVETLVAQGVKEFQVIEQELTYYGVDLYGKKMIAELIRRISDVKGVKWIRLHYAYPTNFPYELLEVIRERKNVCKYLDIALQHISDHMLSRMQRHVSKADTLALIERMRKDVPGICIRTTLMVGFPGETEQDFEELKEFVKWAKFDRMGAFTYSEEEGTYAAKHYKDDVPEDVKERRLAEIMKIQQGISEELNERKVGNVMEVIVDKREGDYYVGRTQYDSPEVDPDVLIPVADGILRTGCMYPMEIVKATDFELYARRVRKS